MEYVMAICLGIGLSAACGFRVFIPLLGVNIAAQAGHLQLAEGFEWIGSWPAFAALCTATGLEIAAYYVPWLDNLLDSIATPAAVIAGTIVTAAMVHDMSPMLRWTLAAIAGGGTAAVVQTGTVALRGTSSVTTLGLANPLVSSGELVSSVVMTVASLVVPVLAVIGLLAAVIAVAVWFSRTPGKPKTTPELLILS